MSEFTTPTKRVAFFGATGDCAGYCLATALKAGSDCIALARTPAKLTTSMQNKGVNSATLDKHLTIIPGDVRDLEAVKKALMLRGRVVDAIVSGIGSNPTLQWSIRRPVILLDETICEDATRVLLQALGQLQLVQGQRPLLINVSTTGIPPHGKPRDVPLAFLFLYHYLLAAPHEDKQKMEKQLAEHMSRSEDQRAIAGYVEVKPSLLMDGESQGLQSIRDGTYDEPAIGYTIRRQDVGIWMYERLLKQNPKAAWINAGVSITC